MEPIRRLTIAAALFAGCAAPPPPSDVARAPLAPASAEPPSDPELLGPGISVKRLGEGLYRFTAPSGNTLVATPPRRGAGAGLVLVVEPRPADAAPLESWLARAWGEGPRLVVRADGSGPAAPADEDVRRVPLGDPSLGTAIFLGRRRALALDRPLPEAPLAADVDGPRWARALRALSQLEPTVIVLPRGERSDPALLAEARDRLAFRDLRVSQSECREAAAAPMTRAAALDDVAVLERVLRLGYAGFERREREGVDWDKLFAQVRDAALRAPEPLRPDDLAALLSEQLAALKDRHLTLRTPGGARTHAGGVHKDAYAVPLVLSDAPASPKVVWSRTPLVAVGSTVLGCSTELKPSPTLWGEPLKVGMLAVTLATSPPPAVECRVRAPRGQTVSTITLPFVRLRTSMEPAAAHPPRDGAAPPAFETPTKARVTTLRLRRLFGPPEPLQAFVAAASGAGRGRAAVLDLRGNPGGDDRYVYAFFDAFSGGEVRFPNADKLESEVTLQGEVNAATCDGDAGRASAASAALAQAEARGVRGRRFTRSGGAVAVGHGPLKPAALVVLVDARCAGACEIAVRLARKIPGAVIVGENSAGGAPLGDLALYRLPSSGVLVQAEAKSLHWDDDPVEVGRGVLPDAWVDEDAGVHAQRLASCLAEPRCAAHVRPALGIRR